MYGFPILTNTAPCIFLAPPAPLSTLTLEPMSRVVIPIVCTAPQPVVERSPSVVYMYVSILLGILPVVILM